MNDAHWQRVTQERERLSARPIWIGGSVFVAITLLGMIMAWVVLRVAEPPWAGAALQPGSGRDWARRETSEEVNGMRTSLFPATERRQLAPSAPSAAAEHLRAYGWVDREQQIVHVPLERAKALYLERLRRHAAAPAPERLGR
jgi:hypothetical protein